MQGAGRVRYIKILNLLVSFRPQLVEGSIIVHSYVIICMHDVVIIIDYFFITRTLFRNKRTTEKRCFSRDF